MSRFRGLGLERRLLNIVVNASGDVMYICTCVCVSLSLSLYMYTYIYIYIERERY